MNEVKKSDFRRRQYDAAFKAEAVRHWEGSGLTARAIAKQYGITPGMLYQWRSVLQPLAPAWKRRSTGCAQN